MIGNDSIARKWLELNWLRRGFKEIPLPEIVFTDLENTGGYYLDAANDEILIGDRYYDGRNGVIVVGSIDDDKDILNIMSHEWRHHWQYQTIPYHLVTPWKNRGESYKENIIDFF